MPAGPGHPEGCRRPLLHPRCSAEGAPPRGQALPGNSPSAARWAGRERPGLSPNASEISLLGHIPAWGTLGLPGFWEAASGWLGGSKIQHFWVGKSGAGYYFGNSPSWEPPRADQAGYEKQDNVFWNEPGRGDTSLLATATELGVLSAWGEPFHRLETGKASPAARQPPPFLLPCQPQQSIPATPSAMWPSERGSSPAGWEGGQMLRPACQSFNKPRQDLGVWFRSQAATVQVHALSAPYCLRTLGLCDSVSSPAKWGE